MILCRQYSMKNDEQAQQTDHEHAIICYKNNKEKSLCISQYVYKHKKILRLYNDMQTQNMSEKKMNFLRAMKL